jgi:transcriptional regulator with PAS, ATPase and Fis domain
MREAARLAERVSSTDANVLITGESGAGKDLLAAFIHSKSRRAAHPFVKIDCATLPADLLEAELFGYERGAFTGAVEAKGGRFEAADKGTVVLDEIAHLSTDAQAKLLRVIERREFERLGGRKTIKLDARVIALTNVDLDAAVKNGRACNGADECRSRCCRKGRQVQRRPFLSPERDKHPRAAVT